MFSIIFELLTILAFIVLAISFILAYIVHCIIEEKDYREYVQAIKQS